MFKSLVKFQILAGVILTFQVSGILGCSHSSGGDSSTTPSAPPAATPAPYASTNCKSSVIDTGQKGSVATVARGVYSDVKIIPGTANPATAFTDPSALTLKFSYWNGSQFVTEVVSGDGSGAFVKLAFLPNGTPLIFWTLGVNLKVAIRTTPVGTPGTWFAGAIDTGTAPRAVEASVNPLGEIAVTFLTDTAVAGRAKFLFCETPCTTPAGFQSMGSNPYIENTNIIAAQVGTGSGWCQVSPTQYYPVAAYSVTGNTKYAVCANTLANCLNGTNWTTQVVAASASTSTKLNLDSTVAGDIPKVVLQAGSGIVPYSMGTTACATGVAAFTAGSAIGTATSGNLWMTLMKDSFGKFHLAANESTTSVRYYNSTTTTITSAWNTAGVADTTTLAAASSGGADIDNTTAGVYISYAYNVLPYDVKLARVNDYTQTSNTATYTRFIADTTGDVQLSAASAQLKLISAASTSKGIPGVAYADYSIGASANAKLKFALRSGATAASPWGVFIIPDTINPEFPSLVFDGSDNPWISYFDAGTNRFYLTTNSSTNGSGAWSTFEFPVTPSGAPIALPAANNTALTVVTVSGQTYPMMAVIDTNVTSKGVKAAMFNTKTRSWSNIATVDSFAAGNLGAAHLSINANPATGDIVLAYQELNATKVKYAYSAGGATWTTPVTISSLNEGPGTNIMINPKTGSPAVSYYDQPNNLVYVSQCSGSPAACATSGWTPVQVEGAAGVSGLAAANGQLLSTALGFSLGKPYIFYPRGESNDGNLILTNNSSGNFVSVIAAYGSNASLPASPALNFGAAGWNISMAQNAVGSFSGAYLGPGNWIYSLTCGD